MADIPIDAIPRRVQFTGNTGLGPFAFTFNILAAADIAVYKNATLLTITTDYTVSVNANGTGSVTLTGAGSGTALVAADYLTIIGDLPLARTTDFTTAGDLLASALNDQLDANVVMTQQISERVDRALRQDPSDTDSNMTIPVKAVRAQKLLAFDSSGAVTVQPYLNNETIVLVVQTEVGDGVTTTYSLETSTNSPSLLQIAIDGVLQEVSSYGVSGGNLVFSAAPPLQSAIEIRAFVQKEITSTDLKASDFTGDGSTTSFTLGYSAVKSNTFVYIDGVYQLKNTYSVSGTTITFSTAPPLNSVIEVVIAAFTTSVIATPSADSVGTAQLQDNAVTTAKIADDAVTAAKLASDAVVTASIVDDNVTQAKIADDAVGADQLASNAVVTASISDDAVTAAKIASEPISVGITSVVTATSLTATVNTHVYVSAATQTITLPASPAIGQRVLITVGNFTDTVVARNGSNIMSSATDFTLDAAYLSIQFIYTDATQGWVMS